MIRVHIAGPEAPAALAERFQARGDQVSFGEPIPQNADLYLFGGGGEMIKLPVQGLVILDLRSETDLSSAPWAAYADLCLVADAATRTRLVEAAACEPERIFVPADETAILELVDRALRDDLPPPSPPKGVRMGAVATPAAAEDTTSLAARLQVLKLQADIMHHDYEVRSRLPVVGPLVAWVRRNLTSHLREPYLDPTLE
ncbi:MAG: hypothetical protein M8467_12370, partial [Anaerolineae bacterium]|nr:hypothetical protein [Anaerolineae bacterium]